jgi:hypothetical protein
MIQKVWNPTTRSDNTTYMNLWEGIKEGKVTQTDIDAAGKTNLINGSDWRSLREKYYAQQVEGENEVETQALSRVKIIARENFGSDPVKQAQFLYVWQQQAEDKQTFEDKIGVANRLIESDPTTGFLGLGKKANWKTALKQMDEQVQMNNAHRDSLNTAYDKLYLEVGKDEMNAIGRGVLLQGKQTWGLTDVDEFANSVGGYDKIKSGQPANNAMKSLIRNNYPVNKTNIDWILKQDPSGNWK